MGGTAWPLLLVHECRGGARELGMQSLPVAFGTTTASYICCATIDVTQLSVAAYLYLGLGEPVYALVLLGLTLPQVRPPPPPPPPCVSWSLPLSPFRVCMQSVVYLLYRAAGLILDCSCTLLSQTRGCSAHAILPACMCRHDANRRQLRLITAIASIFGSGCGESHLMMIATDWCKIPPSQSMRLPRSTLVLSPCWMAARWTQIFLQLKYFLPDPVKNDVKYQASAQPFLVFGLLTTGLAVGHHTQQLLQ